VAQDQGLGVFAQVRQREQGQPAEHAAMLGRRSAGSRAPTVPQGEMFAQPNLELLAPGSSLYGQLRPCDTIIGTHRVTGADNDHASPAFSRLNRSYLLLER
jgi:hypothetical protein